MMIIKPYTDERRSKAKTPAGKEIEPTYGYEIDKKGQKSLVRNGETDVYEKIQEYLEETKIENVIQRVVAGDTSVLRPDGIYEDITNMPSNMLDAMNQIKALENTYENLNEEMKKKYPTIEDFVEKSGQIDWLTDMGYIEQTNIENFTKAAEEPKKEEKANES